MAFSRSRGIVGVITDRRRLGPRGSNEAGAIVAQAAAAATAGADFLQIRERDLDARELFVLVGKVLDAVRGSALRVLVNDRLDIALAIGAHGVHLPSAAVSPHEVRVMVPRGFLVGQSIHGTDAVDSAADFALFGTVFPSASKEAGHATAGVGALADAARRATVPVLAIGGISEATVDAVAHACAGVAAIGWFATTDASRLSDAVRRARHAFDTITRVI